LVSLSLIQRQGLSLDFACLFIYILAISPELFVYLSIYENAETISRGCQSGGAGSFTGTKREVFVGTKIQEFEFGVKYLNFGATYLTL